MIIKVVDTVEGLNTLEDSWNVLYEKCNRSTIFSSWEWMRTWWEVYHDQGRRELFVLCFYHEKELIGIAPFQIDNSFPKSLIQGKTLRFLGSGEARKDIIISQYVDFIVLPGMEELMVSAVSEKLIEHKNKWNFADFEYLLKDALVITCFSKVNDTNVCVQKVDYGYRFYLSELDNFEQYLSRMGKRWHKMFKKKSRLMHRDGEVKTISTSSLETVGPFFEMLSKMHCSRWKEKVDECVFNSTRFSAFHKKILERLVPKNKAMIKTIMLDDKALASYYVFTDKDRVHYYQSGFYSKYANRYSPLFLLVCNEIGETIKNQKLFDFMYDDNIDSYKKKQYAADYERMYRLKWSTHPFRFFVFNCVKEMQNRILDLIKIIKNK